MLLKEEPVLTMYVILHWLTLVTCLSRSATFKGTAIVDGLNERIISGGISGYLRREFRELELLDEITRLSYEGSLSKNSCW